MSFSLFQPTSAAPRIYNGWEDSAFVHPEIVIIAAIVFLVLAVRQLRFHKADDSSGGKTMDLSILVAVGLMAFAAIATLLF